VFYRAAGTAAIDATFPAAEMNLLYPDLEAEGLKGHKVNYVYISNPRQEPNYFVDVTDTIDVKIEALRQHVSQLSDWDPNERMKDWGAEIGKKVGFKYADRFLRIMLKDPEEDHKPKEEEEISDSAEAEMAEMAEAVEISDEEMLEAEIEDIAESTND
jgi:LmbE family N-acetylglucosaminyl deacetylase